MSDDVPAAKTVAFVLKGYPRLSETFIAQEIRALEERGLDIRIYALRHPTDPHTHPIHAEILAPVAYLPEYLHDDPARVWRAWRTVRGRRGYRDARRTWLADLRRDPSRNRVRRFGQALVLAAELPAEVSRLHAHFLHTPASVARYAALICGLPWSCSAHAKDIWTTAGWEIRRKLADLDWLATCTRTGRDHLAGFTARPDKITLVYHGLDLDRFPPGRIPPSERDGRAPEDPVRLLSVGRAVPKKGYPVLLDALARLPSGLNWRLTHIGSGSDLATLKTRAAQLGLADRIDWLGARAQDDVLRAYRAADLFVLASRAGPDGDRDGLPNVLMEAQSQGLACVATRISGIPELITDGDTGILVPPDDADALARTIAELVCDPARRTRLGTAGAARLRRNFSHADGIDVLAEKFGLGVADRAAARVCA